MTRCPHCKHELRHVAAWGNKPPDPGDFVVCTWCAGISEYGKGGRLSRLWWHEFDVENLAAVLLERHELVTAEARS